MKSLLTFTIVCSGMAFLFGMLGFADQSSASVMFKILFGATLAVAFISAFAWIFLVVKSEEHR
jgi:hypothetical protein